MAALDMPCCNRDVRSRSVSPQFNRSGRKERTCNCSNRLNRANRLIRARCAPSPRFPARARKEATVRGAPTSPAAPKLHLHTRRTCHSHSSILHTISFDSMLCNSIPRTLLTRTSIQRTSIPRTSIATSIPRSWRHSMATFSRLVRYIPASSSNASTPQIGEPVDASLDVGLQKENSVEVNVYSGTSVLNPGQKTGQTALAQRILSPLSAQEVGSIRCIGLNVGLNTVIAR